ncbi:unnamed protein product [Debaryomyces tyrocola]|nr:unnamed protein product [Debaryomyces tyrocola]
MSHYLANSRNLDNDVMQDGEDAFIENKNPNTKRIAICNYNPSKDLIIFTSDEAIDEYKQANKLSKKSDNFDLYLQKQQQGLAMPLLEAKFHKRSKFGGSKFLTINKFTSPPPGAKKLFDKGSDKFKFCTIFKDSAKMYDKYTFKFEPNPQNSSENFEMYSFVNRKSRISDIPKMGNINERFRWARTDRDKVLPYTYTLFMLDAGQPSMLDNLDTTNMELGTKNMELDPQNEYLTLLPEQYLDLCSPHALANLIHLNYSRSSYAIQRTARLDLKIPKDRRNLDSESIQSVTLDELIFITNSVIFKYFEELGRSSDHSLTNVGGISTMGGYALQM